MNYQKNKKKIIRELLQSSDKDLTDEELIDEILSTNVTESSNKNEKASFGQKPPTPLRNLRAAGRSFSVSSPSWQYG